MAAHPPARGAVAGPSETAGGNSGQTASPGASVAPGLAPRLGPCYGVAMTMDLLSM
jgi:hypothetical protein